MERVILITTSSFDTENNPAINQLAAAGYVITSNPHARKLALNEVKELLQRTRPVGIIAGTEPLTREVLEENPQLRAISRCGIGLDTVDVETAKRLGVEICTTPDAPTAAVAELALALMLSLLRQVPEADRSVRKREFRKPLGRLLRECTVGIIGYGRIGREVARLCSSFGASILVTDIRQPPDLAGVNYVALEELLRDSDIVSLHVPATPQTENLIDASTLAQMKPGAILLNLSRGGVVNEPALVHALRNRTISGAALDVFEREPYDGPLCDEDKVILTPHMGSYTRETRSRMEFESAHNLALALEKQQLA